ncbi:MAG: M20/M25/M40 family metallo-hydrolase [Candidatus Helarchaeota archaeon]
MKYIELLKKAVEIPSFSGNEEVFGKFLLKMMNASGFNAYIDDVGNVIGKIGEGRPVLLLSSHIDTVIGTLPVKIKDEKLYGRGAVDAKGSLMAMVCAAAQFINQSIKGKIIVAGIVEEETTLRGINKLLDTLKHVDFAVFGEPSGVNRICIASKGRIHLHLTFISESGTTHVSTSGKIENPIHIAINFWRNLDLRLKGKPFAGKTTFFSVEPNITVIQGGKTTNSLPDSCELDIDIRFPPGITIKQILHQVDLLITSFHQKTKIQIKSEVLSRIEGFRAEKSTKIAITLKQAIEETLKKEAKFLRKSGTNFMSIIAQRFQIPVVSYGPGDSTLDHTPNEHIDLAEYQQSIEVIKKFIHLLLVK